MFIATVSTIRDSLVNFDKFIDRNLSAGVDVIFVFLDSPNESIKLKYEAHSRVFVFEAYGEYWHDISCPKNLNQRQKINANIANSILSQSGSDAWLFHIDGDEQICIDKAKLFSLDKSIDYIRLEPLEYCPNVSMYRDVKLFKKKLSDLDLQLLSSLKCIDSPTNLNYFNGHLVGKPGIKVDYKKTIDIHKVHMGSKQQPFCSHEFKLLHFEALRKDEFIKKNLQPSSSTVNKIRTNIRAERKVQLQAIESIRNSTANVNEKIEFLTILYDDFYLKKEEVACKLGYLVEDPRMNCAFDYNDEADFGYLRDYIRLIPLINKSPYSNDQNLYKRISQLEM